MAELHAMQRLATTEPGERLGNMAILPLDHSKRSDLTDTGVH
jgi:hypothetical protein